MVSAVLVSCLTAKSPPAVRDVRSSLRRKVGRTALKELMPPCTTPRNGGGTAPVCIANAAWRSSASFHVGVGNSNQHVISIIWSLCIVRGKMKKTHLCPPDYHPCLAGVVAESLERCALAQSIRPAKFRHKGFSRVKMLQTSLGIGFSLFLLSS